MKVALVALTFLVAVAALSPLNQASAEALKIDPFKALSTEPPAGNPWIDASGR